MIDSHVWLLAAVAEPRNVARGLIGYHTQVGACRTHRPGIDVSEPMACGKLHGVQNAAVIPNLNSGISPPVKAMTHIAPIVESRLLFQTSLARAQRELHTPLHAVNSVDVSYPNGSAAILFASRGIVDRRNGHPIVRYRKIELDAHCGPHATICNSRKFDARVGIEHRRAVDLVNARI